jgi:hypothetical protein
MNDQLAMSVGKELGMAIGNALDRMRYCLDQLTDEQVWQRPAPDMNSIGNLLLHLAGNVRQWIISGLHSPLS